MSCNQGWHEGTWCLPRLGLKGYCKEVKSMEKKKNVCMCIHVYINICTLMCFILILPGNKVYVNKIYVKQTLAV